MKGCVYLVGRSPEKKFEQGWLYGESNPGFLVCNAGVLLLGHPAQLTPNRWLYCSLFKTVA